MNRLWHDSDQKQRVTTYTYWTTGMLQSVLDPKNQLTQFRYDEARDLRTKLIYPDTTELTGWVYDNNGNVTTRPTIGGPKQTFGYDERASFEPSGATQ